MTNPSISPKAKRGARLQWVPLDLIRINERAQREFRESWAEELLAHFDIDKLQYPTVNHRDGRFYVIDGQHSIWAYKMWLGSWDDQKIECVVHEGLSEEQEAELFLSLNNKRTVNLYDRFRVAVAAGRIDECNIDSIVRAQGCKITSNTSQPGAISAVGALQRIYREQGAEILGVTVGMIRDSYGDAGFEAGVLSGLALVLGRYPSIHVPRLQIALHDAHGGSKGLLNAAASIRAQTGGTVANSVAAAVVNIYNRSKGSKLPSWWKTQEAA